MVVNVSVPGGAPGGTPAVTLPPCATPTGLTVVFALLWKVNASGQLPLESHCAKARRVTFPEPPAGSVMTGIVGFVMSGSGSPEGPDAGVKAGSGVLDNT